MEYKERLAQFESILSTKDLNEDPVIDLYKFRHLCFRGIPDEPGIRQKSWKILIGYLPTDKRKWRKTLDENRKTYYSFVRDLLANPSEEELRNPSSTTDDHVIPLNSAPNSKWAEYFADNLILEQIDNDVRRTLPDLAFFHLPVPHSSLSPLSPKLSPKDISNSGNSSSSSNNNNNNDKMYGSGIASPSIFETLDLTNDDDMSNCSDSTIITPNSELDAEVAALEAQLTIIAYEQQQQNQKSLKKYINNSNNSNNNNNNNHGNYNYNSSSPFSSRSTSVSYNAPIDFYNNSDGFNSFKDENNNNNNNNNSYNNNNNNVTPIPSRRSIFKRVQNINRNSTRGVEYYHNRPSSPIPSYVSDGSHDDGEIDLHWEAIERILFIYAKLNPGVGYVQGMNKILGPIYYTMANDGDEEGKAHAEADSFFVFTLLMSHIRDHFVGSLDMDDSTGIGHTMKKLNRRLKNFAYELWADLEKKALHPTYYSFRWITVMLTQEFTLPDVIRLWDSIFADRDSEESNSGFEFLIDFCCAMLICVENQLLVGTLQDNIKLLQNYPVQDPLIILSEAYVIREKRLLAKLNGEDVDIPSDSEAEENEYYASCGASGNVYYDNHYNDRSLTMYNNNVTRNSVTSTTAINSTYQRAQEVKLKGLAMLRKVKDAVNGAGATATATITNSNIIGGNGVGSVRTRRTSNVTAGGSIGGVNNNYGNNNNLNSNHGDDNNNNNNNNNNRYWNKQNNNSDNNSGGGNGNGNGNGNNGISTFANRFSMVWKKGNTVV